MAASYDDGGLWDSLSIPSQEAVADRMRRMPEKTDRSYHTALGSYRGLECGLILHPLGGTEVYLDGAARCREQPLRDNPGARAVLTALERLADGYEGETHRLKAEIGVKEGQLADYRARLDVPFGHTGHESQSTDLRDRLKLALSENPPEGETASKLAEKLKALRVGNTVVAAERTGERKASRAGEPVTARIRVRRVEEMGAEVTPPAPNENYGVAKEIAPAVPSPVSEAEEPVPESAVIALPGPVKPAADYRQAVVKRRLGHGRQLSLF